MLRVSAQTITKKYLNNRTIDQCPNIKTSGLVKKRESPMSARLREGCRSGKSPVSKSKKEGADFPKGAILKLACEIPLEKNKMYDSKSPAGNKQLPNSLNNSGILSPSNGTRKKARFRGPRNKPHSGEIKTLGSPKAIASRKIETKNLTDSSTIAFGQTYRPESTRALKISTTKEPADATQTRMERTKTLGNKTPKNSKMKRNRSPQQTHHRSLTKNEQSFSPKTRNARSNLIRKFLEVKVKTTKC